MIVQELLHAQSSHFNQKTPYKKPQYKSFRQLLQLDRPRKKISYESEQQNDDFLEKLMNQQKQKQNDKKNKKKTKNNNNKNEPKTTIKQKPPIFSRQSNEKIQRNPQTNKSQSILNPIFLIEQSKHQNIALPQLKLQQQSILKIESQQQTKNKQPLSKVQLNGVSNPTFIQEQLKSTPNIIYLSTNKVFQSTLSPRKQKAYQQLLTQKSIYRKTTFPHQAVSSNLVHQHIEHQLKATFNPPYSFVPNIQPVTANWRYNLTFHQQKSLPHKNSQFINRKTLFKNKLQEDKFVKSLKSYKHPK